MRHIGIDERRARLGLRQSLTAQVESITCAADSVYAIHSSDPATVFLACWARIRDFQVSDLEDALYEERKLVRILGMRRTMWVVPTERASTINSSSTAALVDYQMRRTAKLIEGAGVATDGLQWIESVMAKTRSALVKLGPSLATELTAVVPELGEKIQVRKKDGSVAGAFGASTRILFLLSTRGEIVRAKPRGTWISSQYRWVLTEAWVGEPFAELDPRAARAETLHDYLDRFGPATEVDLKWWTGWNLGQVRAALEDLRADAVSIDDGEAYLLSDDVERARISEPWVALLPGLDPTTMGWKVRDWYLGDTAGRLFDRNGNAGPTVWANGEIVGGWAQSKSGDIRLEFLSDRGREQKDAVENKAHELESWLRPTIVTPRFRAPLERELAST